MIIFIGIGLFIACFLYLFPSDIPLSKSSRIQDHYIFERLFTEQCLRDYAYQRATLTAHYTSGRCTLSHGIRHSSCFRSTRPSPMLLAATEIYQCRALCRSGEGGNIKVMGLVGNKGYALGREQCKDFFEL
jgi:hypothetical protein